jgi:ABC-type lipoprotein release transport system permease subunit
VLGAIGGFGGLILAWIVSLLIQWGVNEYAMRRGAEGPIALFSFPRWLLSVSILHAVVVSIASSLHPASRAAKVDPIQALRRE